MLSSYNSTTQTVETGSAYLFDTNRISTGCTVGHELGTGTFVLNRPGFYYVSFNTTFTTETTGIATVELRNGTTTIPGALGSETITTAGDTKSVSFAAIVKVLPSCPAVNNATTLTFVATGIDLTVSTAVVNITKLC